MFPGPLCSVLVNRFGCRPVMMVGGLFASLGMILASFSTSIVHIYLTTGVITGETTCWLHVGLARVAPSSSSVEQKVSIVLSALLQAWA